MTSFDLEFKESIVRNKPEFDGKFFVKLHRTSSLETNALFATGAYTTYNAYQQYPIAYVESTKTNMSQDSGTYSDDQWAYQGNEFAPDTVYERFASCEYKGQTRDYRVDYVAYHGTTQTPFIDGATSRYMSVQNLWNDADYYKPQSISEGGTSDGTAGEITISYIQSTGGSQTGIDANSQGAGPALLSAMEGFPMFRFQDYPNGSH